jgi:hypothetical protein
MRKITAALLIAASSLAVVTTPALADRGRGGAIAGALIGGAVIGAVIGANSNRGPVVVESGPRYYAPAPVRPACFDPYSGEYVRCYSPPPPPRYVYAPPPPVYYSPPPPRYYGPPPPRYYRDYRGW